jgi:hypothetical protein
MLRTYVMKYLWCYDQGLGLDMDVDVSGFGSRWGQAIVLRHDRLLMNDEP